MSIFPGLTIGAMGMNNASNALQIVSNNIANVSTEGFKQSRAVQSNAFSSFLPGGSPGDQIGHGALQIRSQRLTSQGSTVLTGIESDVAIDGNGWFILKGPASTELLYSRAGNFRLDANRFLVNPGGKRVQGYAITNGAVGTTLTDISIASLTSTGSPTTKVTLKGNLNSSAAVMGKPPAFTSGAKKDELIVAQGVNDQIVFQMNQGGPAITASLVTQGGLASGAAVTGAALANALKQALEAQNGTPDIYDVTYSQASDRFNIRSAAGNTGTITFFHDNPASTASALLGFAAARSGNIAPGGDEQSDVGVAFNVLAGVNNTLNAAIEGTPVSVTIAAGNYTGQELALAIERALRSTSSQNAGVQVLYNQAGAADQFILKGPRTGGAHTISQPSNTTNPSIPVPATQVSVTGGTLAATTSFNIGTAANGEEFFDIADPFATSSSSTVVQIVDGLGNQHQLTMFIRKAGDNTWEWHTALDGSEITGPTPDGKFEELASGLVRFTGQGKLETETATAGTGVFNFDQKNGSAVPPANQAIAFDFGDSIVTNGGTGLDGVSQFESSALPSTQGGRGANVLTLTTVQPNGVPGGSFVGLSIGPDGTVETHFSNGRGQDIFMMPLALFPAEEELTALSQNLFRWTSVAGQPVVAPPRTNGAGALLPRSIEHSNVEISEQFGEMIFQQHAFQANSRVIATSNDLLETLVNII